MYWKQDIKRTERQIDRKISKIAQALEIPNFFKVHKKLATFNLSISMYATEQSFIWLIELCLLVLR